MLPILFLLCMQIKRNKRKSYMFMANQSRKILTNLANPMVGVDLNNPMIDTITIWSSIILLGHVEIKFSVVVVF